MNLYYPPQKPTACLLFMFACCLTQMPACRREDASRKPVRLQEFIEHLDSVNHNLAPEFPNAKKGNVPGSAYERAKKYLAQCKKPDEDEQQVIEWTKTVYQNGDRIDVSVFRYCLDDNAILVPSAANPMDTSVSLLASNYSFEIVLKINGGNRLMKTFAKSAFATIVPDAVLKKGVLNITPDYVEAEKEYLRFNFSIAPPFSDNATCVEVDLNRNLSYSARLTDCSSPFKKVIPGAAL